MKVVQLLAHESTLDESMGANMIAYIDYQHLKEGIGSDLMTYIDFANATHWKAHLRQKYDELAYTLLSKGFKVQVRPSINRLVFAKRTLEAGTNPDKNEVTLVIINNDITSLTSVNVFIGKGHQNKQEIFSIDELVGPTADLDFILSGQDH